MWLELDLSCVGSELRAAARGQRGEQTAPRSIGLDLEAVRSFASAVRSAAARGRPLPATATEAARALHRAVLGHDIEPIRARLAEAADGPLLIRLSLHGAELQAVPWEALCKPDEAMGFWASSPDALPVRSVTTGEPLHPRVVRGALRVLAVAPAGGKALELLKDALSARISAGELEWLAPIEAQAATARNLFDRLRREPAPHVIHFLGHGGLQEGVPALRLADDDDGDETWLPVELLAQQLKASLRGLLRLIVLEACEGARPGAFASAAETLVRAGAAAVVAHLWPVKADLARACSAELYRALVGGAQARGDIALAMNEARRAILGASGGSAEAFSPVVYLRGPDSVIFELRRETACLVLDPGTQGARAFPLRPGITRIGRAADNDIVLQRQGISRRHAEVQVDGDRIDVIDCDSHNGCYVNGARVTRARVRIGDVLRLGDIELELAAEDIKGAPRPAFQRNVHALHFPGSNLQPPAAASEAEARLAVLLQASQLLVSPDGVERMLDRVLELAMQLLPIDRVAVLLLDEAGELAPRGVRSRLPIPPGERIWSRSVVDFVMRHITAALFADAAADPRIQGAGSVLAQGIHAAMGTPLKVGDRVLGALYADRLQGDRPLQQQDLDLLVGFANQAALALDNASSRERARDEALAHDRLERFLPAGAADRILGAGATRIEVREARVTALCCDIPGYAERTLTISPRAAFALIEEVLGLVEKAVFDEGGTLERAAGAAALAVWGAPLPCEDDADRAVAAALAIQRGLAGRGLEMSLGIHTGPVAAGTIGAEKTLRFVAAGETIELARRICGAAGAGAILVSAETAAALRGELTTQPAGQVPRHGASLDVYRLLPA